MYDMAGHRVGTYKYTATINPPQGYFTATERDYWCVSRLIYRWTTTGAGPVMQDRLGSVRADSGTGSAVYSGFYPYGEEKGTATANDRVKFGTYRRDGDTGLDYAEQRYYSSAMGRFLRPDYDWGSANSVNPRSWNRYAYTLNDPINLNDPTGLDTVCTMPDGEGGQAACYETAPGVNGVALDSNGNPTQVVVADTSVTVTATFDPVIPDSDVSEPTSPTGIQPGGPTPTGASSGGSALPKSANTNSSNQKANNCLDSFNNSTIGAATKFFSPISLITNFSNAWLDWTMVPLAKLAILQSAKQLSNALGNTEFLSIIDPAASTTIVAPISAGIEVVESLSPIGIVAIPFATAVDAGVRNFCGNFPNRRLHF